MSDFVGTEAPPDRQRWVQIAGRWTAWALSAAVVLLIVLPWSDLQNHPHWAKVQWIPFVTPPIKRIDLIGNVLLYMPFGFLGRKALPNRSSIWIVAVAGLLSASTEATQLYTHRRYPSTTDLVCNVAGCTAGLYCARPSRRRSALIFSQEFLS